jgi:hypothetical protein
MEVNMLSLLILVALMQQPAGVTHQISEVSGVVDRTDRAGRMVNITTDDGAQMAIYVGPELAGFDQLSRGDHINVRLYDSYIVEVTPRARMAPLADTTAEAQKKLNTAETTVVQQLQLVVTVDEINRRDNTVIYHTVDNRRVMRAVQDPKLLEHVKVGDVVTITYMRERAASIQKR